ncbi:Hypothetical predicted protein [Mytilus galloprovincialis]|uniref:C2H2-type domain-containing protein n=1 Tax=Mytilus galloprovincialis TaxID=29158 RepID=A0A8B6CMV1_MYTGA|nr:Hypothetical predicted protein [Mytilus galloprovincialis]
MSSFNQEGTNLNVLEDFSLPKHIEGSIKTSNSIVNDQVPREGDLYCPEMTCSRKFKSYSELEDHCFVGDHALCPIHDLIKLQWKGVYLDISSCSVKTREGSLQTGDSTLQSGWGLKKDRKSVRLSFKTKDKSERIFFKRKGEQEEIAASTFTSTGSHCDEDVNNFGNSYNLESAYASFKRNNIPAAAARSENQEPRSIRRKKEYSVKTLLILPSSGIPSFQVWTLTLPPIYSVLCRVRDFNILSCFTDVSGQKTIDLTSTWKVFTTSGIRY